MGMDKMLKPFSIPGDWDGMSLKSLETQMREDRMQVQSINSIHYTLY
jgi:hypothetical protein